MSPNTEGHYENASDETTGSVLYREQPMRQISAPMLRAPSLTRGQPGGPGQSGQGTHRKLVLAGEAPPPTAPPNQRRSSALDWVLPRAERPKTYVPGARTVENRLQPTLDHARLERTKSERTAMLNGYTLNAAIGLQIVLGALVTGLSAVVAPKRAAIVTSVLGGGTTVVASYLARMRGSREPELSLARTKDLDHLIREAEAFQLDHGQTTDASKDAEVEEFRRRLEEMLGNNSAQTKLQPA
ncbi:hypothetical protein FIBSPDRAFT_857262 [Athelia psychrophila]|uniref:SMODS and SLOG-associating 2TM effector domain-containing protein n=1 Tax=Athelia psychrophila TaxID=1759441 RepID=A0A166MQG3_9AGAM|nr:hypothetical protein FIBSPDRAFT_859056 [Fibularhizoctonia sp. CBS 109695]KZP24207.1 hypothetical protein FIBSPDRAFT_857262 [Fibularhizoctonia sp. CBS 109695]